LSGHCHCKPRTEFQRELIKIENWHAQLNFIVTYLQPIAVEQSENILHSENTISLVSCVKAYLHSETARAIQLPSNRQTNVHRQKHNFLGEHKTFEHFFRAAWNASAD